MNNINKFSFFQASFSKGFVSPKTGKTFDASLKLDGNKVVFNFNK